MNQPTFDITKAFQQAREELCSRVDEFASEAVPIFKKCNLKWGWGEYTKIPTVSEIAEEARHLIRQLECVTRGNQTVDIACGCIQVSFTYYRKPNRVVGTLGVVPVDTYTTGTG